MSNVSVTRMELLARKAQTSLAKQGRDLLEQKRTALMKEFMRAAGAALERSDALQESAAEASQALARAEAMAGDQPRQGRRGQKRADRRQGWRRRAAGRRG